MLIRLIYGKEREMILKKIILVLSVLFLTYQIILAEGEDTENPSNTFLDTSFGKSVFNLGKSIGANPGAFVYDFHFDTQDIAPVPKEKTFCIQTNLLPALLPFTMANISPKIKVLSESEDEWYPQIDVVGGYWSLAVVPILENMKVMPSESKISVYGYNCGTVLTKSVDSKTRLFFGANYSVFNFMVNISSGSEVIFEREFYAKDGFVYGGLEFESKPGKKLIIVQTEYGLMTKKIVSKIILSYGVMDIGLSIFPDGILAFHPIWNMHLRF